MRRRGAALVATVACLSACASEPPAPPTVLEGSATRSVLVLPLNVTVVMPPELEAAGPAVWEELESYLLDGGRDLKTLAHADARRLWLASIRYVRAGEDGARAGFDEAARVFVAALARHAEFDTVMIPSLVLREARISGRQAHWDGVTRAIEFEAYSLLEKRMVSSTPLEGVAPAASLHVLLLDSEGNKLQSGVGGLELLVSVRVIAPRDRSNDPSLESLEQQRVPGRFDFKTRIDLFQDRDQLREGIAKAVGDLLPPLAAPPQ